MVCPECLILLLAANGAPVLARYVAGDRFYACPVDAGRVFFDGRPLFGTTKTVRGVLASVIFTAIVALLMGLPLLTGAVVAVFAMLGDLLSSFLKRRLGIPSGSMAPGLDQVPESLLPLLAVRSQFDLDWEQIVMLVAAFTVIDMVLTRLLPRDGQGRH